MNSAAWVAGVSAVVAGCVATSASAQTAAPDQASVIEEVVVTASKRAEKLQNVPISITAETGQALARRGATDINDMVATTPGLYNASQNGAAGNNIVMRGVSAGGSNAFTQNTVVVLLDDVDPDPGAVALLRTNLRITDVERIEVLRGPQGTLFGSGALSGAVRYISNKPDLGAFGASVEATATSTQSGSGSYNIQGVINAPIVQDRLGVRLVGYGYDDGGWVDNVLTGRSDVNAVRTEGGRLMVSAKPIDDLSLLFTAVHQTMNQGGSPASFYFPQAGVSKPYLKQDLGDPQTARVETNIYNLVANYHTPWGTLTSNTSYLDRDSASASAEDAYITYLGALLGVPGLQGQAANLVPSQSHTFTQELRFTSGGGGPLRWTVGGYYARNDLTGGERIAAPVMLPLLGVDNLGVLAARSKQTEGAIFGEATYTLADRIDLTAGVRLERSEINFNTQSSGLLLSGSPALVVNTVGDQTSNTANPRFAVAFRQTPDLTWYAQASKGFRTGGPNLTAGLVGTTIPSTYGPDSLWNFEVGEKARLFGGRLSINSSVYLIKWTNMQVQLFQGLTYTGNAGDAEVYGFETEVAGRPLPWLELGGSLSASHGETTSGVPNLVRVTGLIGTSSGERLPGAPQFQGSLYAQSSFRLFGQEAYARAGYQYVGDAYTDFDEKGMKYGDYGKADLRVGMVIDRAEVVGFVDNLFNTHGAVSAADAIYLGTLQGLPALAYRVRPRTVGITVRAHF